MGVHQILCDNQIRSMLDPVPPETLFPLMATISDELYRDGYLDRFRSINDTFLIAHDGTDFFSSEKISCPDCTQTTLKNGKTLNCYIAVTPVLVAPGQSNVIVLPPQFVQPQEGHDKQDCEMALPGSLQADCAAELQRLCEQEITMENKTDIALNLAECLPWLQVQQNHLVTNAIHALAAKANYAMAA